MTGAGMQPSMAGSHDARHSHELRDGSQIQVKILSKLFPWISRQRYQELNWSVNFFAAVGEESERNYKNRGKASQTVCICLLREMSQQFRKTKCWEQSEALEFRMLKVLIGYQLLASYWHKRAPNSFKYPHFRWSDLAITTLPVGWKFVLSHSW